MFDNLKKALQDKHITVPMFAKNIEACESSTRHKLNGETEFTYSEIAATAEFFPEYRLEWLFDSGKDHPIT